MHLKIFQLPFLFFLLQLFPSLASAEDLLSRSVYKGTISGWKIEMTRTLTQKSASEFELKSEARNMIASVYESSQFEIKDGELRPLHYIYERKILGRRVVETIRFDWSTNKAYYSRSDRPQNNTTHTLTPGLLDPALYQLLMQADLSQNKQTLSYDFIKRKRIEKYRFELLKEDVFVLDKQSQKALLVIHQDEDKDKNTKLWILPNLNYQIAQIQHLDDGDLYEVRLSEHRDHSEKLQDFFKKISKLTKDSI